jgi:hypothetical protein
MSRSRDPWRRWLDGEVHVVTQGADVPDLARFRAAFSKYGKRHGLRVITRDVGKGQVVVRSLGPA